MQLIQYFFINRLKLSKCLDIMRAQAYDFVFIGLLYVFTLILYSLPFCTLILYSLVVNPIIVDGYASLFNCMTAVRASDSMTASS